MTETATPEDFAAAEWASEEEYRAYVDDLLNHGKGWCQMGSDGKLHRIDPSDVLRKPEEREPGPNEIRSPWL